MVLYLLGKKEQDVEDKFGYGNINPAAQGNLALVWAAQNGHVDVVICLFWKKESGTASQFGYQDIDPAANGNKAIRLAFANKHDKVISFLFWKKKTKPELYSRISLEQQ